MLGGVFLFGFFCGVFCVVFWGGFVCFFFFWNYCRKLNQNVCLILLNSVKILFLSALCHLLFDKFNL